MFGINEDNKQDQDSTINNEIPMVIDPATTPASVTDDNTIESNQTTLNADDSSMPTVNDHQTNDRLDDLLALKQHALEDLSPLVDHLNQTPEEKFRTTMMMIQASDNKGLLSAAYQAAQTIKNDTARAQALLDIVNEINYFIQNKQ